MVAFKVYVLQDDGHVISQVDLFCNMGQAKEWAKALVDDKPVELWKGPIRIARFEPWPSREQISTGRRETHVSAALMHRQPAALDGERHARAVLGGAALVPEQERPVNQLDKDAPVLNRLDGTGDLHDTTRSFLGIGVGARLGVFHVLRIYGLPVNWGEASITVVAFSCARGLPRYRLGEAADYRFG